MDEELLPTASTMPVIASTNFPTPTTPTTPSIYPNLQQEIVQDLSSQSEEVNTGSQQLGRSPSINPVVTASSSNSSTTTTTGNNNSYLSTSVNYSSGGNVTFHSSPAHRSKTNRKKSRKLTLTQVCSDGSPASKTQEQQKSMDADRLSNNSSLIGFESDNNSTTTASTSSSLKSGPERKINRIFSMLQTMQQTFLQNNPPQQPPPQPPQQPPTSHHHQGKLPKEPIYEQPHHSNNRSSDSLESGTDTIHSDDRRGQQMRMELQTSSSAPSRQLLYGLGRSQDSLMSTARMSTAGNKTNFMAVNNSNSNVNNKGPIYASWNGSQYSTNTYTTMTSDGAAPPPMTHAMPYHKDGWTSLFIVASSTYAQLLIVICMVAALAEVVTHNVSFLYFEIFFAFLYTVSIIFFLYVFGYLLRSKRRREERKRLRKLSRWKESNMSNPSNNGVTTTEDETSDYDSVQVDRNVSSAMSVENEISASTVPSPMRRFFNNFSGERRRFSRSDPSEMMEGVSSNPHPASRKSSANKQWTMPQNFNLGGGGTPAGEMVSYSTMTSNNSDIVTTHSAAMNGRKAKKTKVSDNEHSHGSLFLRAGAVAFGLGTMIYDGLEFGAFLEVPPDSPCFALLRGLNPLLHAVFVFLQMYFIFVSARLNIHKFKVIARFGLMHCVATNVCVWIRTLVRESLKEINGHYHHYVDKSVKTTSHQPVVSGGYDSASNALLHHLVEAVAAVAGSEESSFEGGASAFFDIVNETFADALTTAAPMAAGVKSKKEISLWELTGNVSCGRRIYLGNIIMDAAPFLYPFLIEYSLIGAAVLYVIWEHIGLNPKYKTEEENNRGIKDESIWNSRTRQLRVDCVGASKGLFMGLFFLTASLLCLVLFFIFVPMPQFKRLGLILGDSAHCTLLLVSLIAMAIGAYRARHLHFHSEHMEELGSILLRISALGIFMYSAFSMIAGALGTSKEEPPTLVFINGLLSVIEVTVQTIFISDMSRRSVNTIEQDREKPGRQSVTFLLITNLTLWLVYTFEMQKVEANPVQLNFYGFMPWSIVQRISLPLCIFYRFHSAMVYAEIWKNSFRYHGPTMEELTTTANISGSAIHLN